MKYGEWKLTDQEIECVEAMQGDINKAQGAKRQAYIEAGGIILNPDALEDLCEVCEGILDGIDRGKAVIGYNRERELRQAITKAKEAQC